MFKVYSLRFKVWGVLFRVQAQSFKSYPPISSICVIDVVVFTVQKSGCRCCILVIPSIFGMFVAERIEFQLRL